MSATKQCDGASYYWIYVSQNKLKLISLYGITPCTSRCKLSGCGLDVR